MAGLEANKTPETEFTIKNIIRYDLIHLLQVFIYQMYSCISINIFVENSSK